MPAIALIPCGLHATQFTGSLLVPFNGNLQTVILSLLTGLIPSTGGHIGPRFMRVLNVTESIVGATANVTILMDSQKSVESSQEVTPGAACASVIFARSWDASVRIS